MTNYSASGVVTSVSFVSLGAKIERSEKYLATLGQLELARKRASNCCDLTAVLALGQAMEMVADAEYLSAKGFPRCALERLTDAQSLVLTAARSRARS